MGSANERRRYIVTSSRQTTLHCNVVSHWLSPYPEGSLYKCRLCNLVNYFGKYQNIFAFYNAEMTWVFATFPYGMRWSNAQPTPWPILISLRCKSPGYQISWYYYSLPWIFRFQHQWRSHRSSQAKDTNDCCIYLGFPWQLVIYVHLANVAHKDVKWIVRKYLWSTPEAGFISHISIGSCYTRSIGTQMSF